MSKSHAFKFLSEGGRGIFSDFRWPLPWDGTPGSWVAAGLPLEPCVNGIHVCREDDLPYWIDDELWVIELRGEVAAQDRMLVAEEGRLVKKVDGWDRETATSFAEACALRARGAAVETLRSAGRNDEAVALESAADLTSIAKAAQTIVRSGRSTESTSVSFAADAAALARGARPEATPQDTASFGAPSAGAIAANLAYVVSHIVGCTGGPPGTAEYESAAERERAWQRRWFHDLVAKSPPVLSS
ncbi:MAG: hypothetical protein M3R37_12905 [Actinomycetota bacterium]|nr:hypothetical protein [Actinomycetota bacterium]